MWREQSMVTATYLHSLGKPS
ncbi:hypothetical protein ACIN8IBEIGE_130009 [Acinetobacter sp. 8I-beige]|nr:hypothetical protein ACIN8IBEIGE_130009 [Acinetobacter sp. 8I-beige]